MTERIKNGKTYTYYFNTESKKLCYWLFYNKYTKNDDVVDCYCCGIFGTDKNRAYKLVVTYK